MEANFAEVWQASDLSVSSFHALQRVAIETLNIQSETAVGTGQKNTEEMFAACPIDFANAGRQHYDDKDFPRRVLELRCLIRK